MCTYNGEKFIAEQLDSILTQTHPVDELIIQDDHSTDGTVEILRRYAAQYPVIQVYVNSANKGFNENFHSAIGRSTSDFVAISDQDDVWYPTKIAEQLDAIGHCDLCYSGYDIGPTPEQSHYLRTPLRLERFLFGGPAGHTMLLRREFLARRNEWIPGVVYDWSVLMNAFFGKGCVCVDHALNWHRRHDNAAGKVHLKKLTGGTAQKAWEPYVFGWKAYRQLQRNPTWQAIYSYVNSRTSATDQPLAHQMTSLMLKPGLIPLLRLCRLCMKNRSRIYPSMHSPHGLTGAIRAFFYPQIFAFGTYLFDFAKPDGGTSAVDN